MDCETSKSKKGLSNVDAVQGEPLADYRGSVAMTLLVLAIVFIVYKFVSPFLGKKIELKVEEPE